MAQGDSERPAIGGEQLVAFANRAGFEAPTSNFEYHVSEHIEVRGSRHLLLGLSGKVGNFLL